jgi:4a-hydroxytetrahydrobiopterin dehydratase
MKLEDREIESRLEQTEGWKREDEKWISRKYRFPKFTDAIAFVNQVAEIAERRNHHPMIAIDYRMVTLRLSSWNAGGITQEDFASAAAYNDVFNKFS